MKRFLFIIPALMLISGLNAQNMKFRTDDYAKEWKEITSLEEQGLPKSALEKVELLLAKSKKDDNPSQFIKCLIHRSKYVSELEEDGFVKAVNRHERRHGKGDFSDKADFAIHAWRKCMLAIWTIIFGNCATEQRPQISNLMIFKLGQFNNCLTKLPYSIG